MQSESLFKAQLSCVYLFCALCLAGCDGVITDHVKSSRPTNTIDNPLPSTVAGGPSAMKVSPGQMKASATNAAVVGNVTATRRLLSSPQVSAQVGISRSRTSQ